MKGEVIQPNILIVDDAPENIELLGRILMPDYMVRVVINGAEAIDIAASENPPDLILLDIMMPGMDGYEICRQLKAEKKTCKIPIIFITAKGEEEDETKGFQMGAVDYISKPFSLSVVKARVCTHLELKKHQDQLESLVKERTKDICRANEQLKKEVKERRQTQAALKETNKSLEDSLIALRQAQDHLVMSEKMAALGNLVAGVAHEINTPVGIGITAASFLTMKTCKFTELVNNKNFDFNDLNKYMTLANEASTIIETNLNRAADLISSFKQVGVDQASRKKRVFHLNEYLSIVLYSLRPKLKKEGHRVFIDCPENLEVDSYPGVFSQIMTNLIINSTTHGFEGIKKGKIDIKITHENKKIKLHYKDNGNGMDKNAVEQIFEPFFTTKRIEGGTGLGMHIVYNLVTQALKGQITCNSSKGKGVSFLIVIPV